MDKTGPKTAIVEEFKQHLLAVHWCKGVRACEYDAQEFIDKVQDI